MNNTISLTKLLNNDLDTVNILVNNIKMNGWCFVKIDYGNDEIIRAKNTIEKLFNSDTKYNHSYTFDIGYFETSIKQQYKLLTNTNICKNKYIYINLEYLWIQLYILLLPY